LAGRIPELDGIRGIAISLVVIRHYVSNIAQTTPGSPFAYALATLSLTWTGVDLFFVLSGFLIGGILWDARQSQNYFSAFYMRRIYRIWPVLFAWLTIYIVATPISNSWVWAGVFGHQIPTLSYALFVQNIVMTSKKTYGSDWLAATWSLAVEEQFYLVLPLVVFAISSARKLAVIVGASSIAAIVFRTWICLHGDFSYGPYMLLPCRADALGCGVLIALAVRDASIWAWLERNGRLVKLTAAALAVGLIPLLFQPFGSWLMSTIGYSWIALFYSALILLALTRSSAGFNRIVLYPPLRSLGTIAYGLYIFHYGILSTAYALVLHRAPQLSNSHELIFPAASLAASLGLATLSWKFMEKPLLRRAAARHKYRSKPELIVRESTPA
jgi:peptidoglycan/LPS O-acetylase OafA/YrhL